MRDAHPDQEPHGRLLDPAANAHADPDLLSGGAASPRRQNLPVHHVLRDWLDRPCPLRRSSHYCPR